MWRADATWRRVTAHLLCAVLLVTSVASLAHARSDHDPDCAPFLTLHDASAHTIGAGTETPEAPPVHCLACHWARSFRPRVETAYVEAPAAQSDVRLLVEAAPVAWASPVSQPPLRSPPA